MTERVRSKMKTAVLEAYEEIGRVDFACKRVGLPKTTFYHWLRTDAEFKEAYSNSNEIVVGLMEDEAKRRGIEGVEEPVFYKGVECGTIRRYSDQLLITLLKAHAPEKYRNNIQADITSKGESISKIIIEDVTGDSV